MVGNILNKNLYDNLLDYRGYKNPLNKGPNYKLCMLAMLCAIYVCLGFISIPLGNIKLTIEGFPIILAGFIFGPVGGMAVGFIGPFIYQILNYGVTVTTLFWILPHVFTGLLAGGFSVLNESLEIITDNLSTYKEYKKAKVDLILFLILTCWISTCLNCGVIYIDSKIYGYYHENIIKATFFIKILIGTLKGTVYAMIMPSLYKSLSIFSE